MKNYSRLGVTAVVVLALGVLHRSNAAPPATAGKVLLLDNQRVLEGDVERDGDQYRVRRDGGETLVPANRVLAVCPDLGAAYRLLRDQTDPGDAEGRLKLARWCDSNNLRGPAAVEAKAAAELRPGHAVTQATYRQLQRKAAVPAPAPVAAPAKLPESILNPPPAEMFDCGAEAFKRFATKVQPVLMNACAACHAGEQAGKFHLERVYADSLNSRQAAQRNLAATLAQIDRAKPAASALLQRATTAHGGAAVPPLRDRSVPAFRQLDEWVRLVLSDVSPPPAPAPAAAEIATTAATVPVTDEKSAFGAGTLKEEPPKPADPFDPGEFTRQHHPGGPKPVPPPPDGPKPNG
jgi:hypothetical protein